MNGYEEKARCLLERANRECQDLFAKLDHTERVNTLKILSSFQHHRVSARNFAPTTGYGYDDIGRDTLSDIMAELLGCEAAVVRPQIASGTHALALCLFGLLRPGDVMISATGKPYDTLEEVIGIRPSRGSLAEYGVTYRQVDLLPDGNFDLEGIRLAISQKIIAKHNGKITVHSELGVGSEFIITIKC